ncbi:SlyX family protein [Nitrogeniibacter mangrovi]|uniref:SlyX family protein n=2 Tax=Nitrogeniibacter mangrovi TaxID=2016596 RepID=A0A6C1BAI2_9RHOO|nr:SlyX family protein [Nitrogeniibacter mangrovi]
MVSVGLCTPARADETDSARLIEQLRRQVAEQREQIDAMRKTMAEQQGRLAEIRQALGLDQLGTLRGAGQPGAGAPPRVAQAAPAAPVGQRPSEAKTEAENPPVAQIFSQPGILTQPGKYVLEPSLQYSYSSSNRVALVGYTVIPALTIGLIDVREVKSHIWTAALTGRMGLTNRLELEGKIPWVYRNDDSISRPIATPASNDEVFNTSGRGLGDIEFTARYQFNDGGADTPYYIGSLRFKSRTGSDQFDTTTVAIPGFQGLGLPKELPTGSGFYSLQPGLTFLFPSDPVVFFGGLNYQYSFKRNDINVKQDDGQGNITVTHFDSVQPGGVFGFNFGMGLALNDKSSFSIGYEHATVGRTRLNGRSDPLSVRVDLGTLLLGYAYRLSPKQSINVALGIGVTNDTPDVQLTLRAPMNF